MESSSDSVLGELQFLLDGGSELWGMVGLSLGTSLGSLTIAAPLAFLLAFVLTSHRFTGQALLLAAVNCLVVVPGLMLGLLLYLLLSRSGPLGGLDLLYTPYALGLGQVLMGFPLLLALGCAALRSLDRRALETAQTLGASWWSTVSTCLWESRTLLAAALTVAFGRILGETGCAMIVGGNILHGTRTVPAAMLMASNSGDLNRAIALGVILVTVACVVVVGANLLQRQTDAST